MSSLHSMKKEIAKRKLMFEADMYTNMWGSVVICAYMFTKESEREKTPCEINKWWRVLKKNPKLVDFGLDDPDFIDKTIKLFGMKRPDNFPIAMVQSKFNVLFMPYVDGQLYPLREDGIYPMTSKNGKVYPVDFTKTTDEDTNNKDGEVAAKSASDEEEGIDNAKRTKERSRHK